MSLRRRRSLVTCIVAAAVAANGCGYALAGRGNVSIAPTNVSAEQQASRYTITVTANIELRDVAKDTVLWTNAALSVREEYDATSALTSDPTGFVDPSTFFNQETNAVERVSTEFSRTVVSAILEAF
jgi:hypothetical protein